LANQSSSYDTAGPFGDSDTEDWRDRGNCRGVLPADLFYPVKPNGKKSLDGYEAQVRAAKTICAGCQVRSECLAYALRTNESGIWGGLTEEERGHKRRLGVRQPA
jgi:WhiB family transcriptional regulator, redox-sensing transcriptional regulator